MSVDQGGVPTFTDASVGRPRDPDLDPFEDELRGDDLDPLAALAEIADPVVLDDITLPHKFRPGWAVRYSTKLDGDDLKRWEKRARVKKGRGEEVDSIRLACIVLANLCVEITRDGNPILAPDDDGDLKPLTFAHPAMWRLYGAGRSAEVVRKFYSNDPYLGATLDAVLAAGGIGEEVEPVDPTHPSSD